MISRFIDWLIDNRLDYLFAFVLGVLVATSVFTVQYFLYMQDDAVTVYYLNDTNNRYYLMSEEKN